MLFSTDENNKTKQTLDKTLIAILTLISIAFHNFIIGKRQV